MTAVATMEPTYGSAEWVAARRAYIGASDVAAVLGLDPYRSPLDVWAEKKGLSEPSPSTQATKMGHLLEPVVCALAEEHYSAMHAPKSVLFAQRGTLVGREEWQRATPDRFVQIAELGDEYGHDRVLDRFLLEAKTKSWMTAKGFGAAGSDQVPDAIMLQCIWQMDVTRLTRCDVGVLVDGRDFSMYSIQYDRELAEDVFEQTRAWWLRHVVGGEEPPVERGSDADYLRRKFRQVGAELLEPSLDVEEAVSRLAELRQAAKKAEEAEALAKARVMELIGEHRGVHCAAGKVSWALMKGRASTNWQAIAESMGVPQELIQQHTSIGAPSRVFRFSPKNDA